MAEPKYPNIEVELSGQDGNGFMIIGRIRRAMRKGGLSDNEIQEFSLEAESGSYSDLLATASKWVSIS